MMGLEKDRFVSVFRRIGRESDQVLLKRREVVAHDAKAGEDGAETHSRYPLWRGFFGALSGSSRAHLLKSRRVLVFAQRKPLPAWDPMRSVFDLVTGTTLEAAGLRSSSATP